MNGSGLKVWSLVLISGIFTVALGLSILSVPHLVREGLETLIAIIIILSGLAQAGYTFSCRRTIGLERPEGFLMSLLLTILALVVGIVILFYHLETVITFTTLIAIYFGLDGVLRIGRGLSMRQHKIFILPILFGITSIAFFLLIWFYMAGARVEVILRLAGALFIARGLVTIVIAFVAREIRMVPLPTEAEAKPKPASGEL